MSHVRTGNRLRWQRGGGLFAVVAITMLGACGGPAPGPETELRNWVQRGVAAVEAKERRELVGMISPAYADARGNDRDQIENTLRAWFFRMNTIELLTAIEEISIIGETAAEISMTVGMAGGHDGVFGFSADAYRFLLELEKHDDDWALISARWGELGEDLR